jgi:hypothetical protein
MKRILRYIALDGTVPCIILGSVSALIYKNMGAGYAICTFLTAFWMALCAYFRGKEIG